MFKSNNQPTPDAPKDTISEQSQTRQIHLQHHGKYTLPPNVNPPI